MKNDFSWDMKRATILFNLPGKGRTTFQESKGCPDEGLRKCIKHAQDVFFADYLAMRKLHNKALANSPDLE